MMQQRSDLENKSVESRSSIEDDSQPSNKKIPNSTPLMGKTRKNLGETLVSDKAKKILRKASKSKERGIPLGKPFGSRKSS